MASEPATVKNRSPWLWVPSLYFAEGIPYVIAMTVSVIMYKTMGVSNAALAFWTSVLYLPWVIKPIWSPFVDVISTKRNWVLITQFILGCCFIGVALVVRLPLWFALTLIVLWIIALASATHDIAADGFYMIGLDAHQQTWFVGIRSTFYRMAMIVGQGLIVMLTGYIMSKTGLKPVSITAMAVPPNEIMQVLDENNLPAIKASEQPNIVVIPAEVKVPIYNPAEPGSDSANVFICLSAPPKKEETVVVNFGRKKGSKDIWLTSAGRLEFTAENWNKPVKVTLKVDHRLREPVVSQFEATAGDIPFSWAVSFGILGVFFLLICLYHKLMLPTGLETVRVKSQELKSSWLKVFSSFFQKKGIVSALSFLLFYRLAESQLVKMASPFLLDSQEAGGLALTTTQVGFVYGTVGIICLTIGGILGGIVAARNGLKRWVLWMALAINIPDLVYVYLSYVQPDNFMIVTICVAIEQFGYGFGFTGYMLFMLYLAEGEYKTSHYAIATAFMALGMMLPGMISGKLQDLMGYRTFFVYIMFCTIPSFLVASLVKIDPDFGKKKIEN
ncbi:MAG TPA: MFS transporter [Candidatus Marinimicrobia bacterium]|nr:MFS transporter [Candidatus Neomarinimicrobiota bacterium]HQM36831.1 MFS transporter [Candidatus Neomarinimicrobiota bacterium]HQQ85908.1 MFS transporter [Candidatus Neomarinimicrobiota bacterium]